MSVNMTRRQDTHHLTMVVTLPALMAQATWVHPDPSLLAGMKQLAQDTMMTLHGLRGLILRDLGGLMVGDHLITICQRGLMDLICLTVQ